MASHNSNPPMALPSPHTASSRSNLHMAVRSPHMGNNHRAISRRLVLQRVLRLDTRHPPGSREASSNLPTVNSLRLAPLPVRRQHTGSSSPAAHSKPSSKANTSGNPSKDSTASREGKVSINSNGLAVIRLPPMDPTLYHSTAAVALRAEKKLLP